ncbi:MAG: hypothetical protein AAB909_02395 [Patescibacteria group bacterium]
MTNTEKFFCPVFKAECSACPPRICVQEEEAKRQSEKTYTNSIADEKDKPKAQQRGFRKSP